jgi:hypothetical protein
VLAEQVELVGVERDIPESTPWPYTTAGSWPALRSFLTALPVTSLGLAASEGRAVAMDWDLGFVVAYQMSVGLRLACGEAPERHAG